MTNLKQSVDEIKASLPRVDFDTKFPSFTFDMATGTGKTKLMAACMMYLYRRRISKNFFVLAPGDTIYRKLIDDFTKGYEKFVFKGTLGLPEFQLITGENYERQNMTDARLLETFTVFVFNIQKIWKQRLE
jgi:type III restriction enzyme